MIENGGGAKGKGRERPITAFYIETLILVAVFTMVILVLTRVFVWSGQLGRKAALLTNAVHLAENAAEAVAASDSLEELQALLDENGNTAIVDRATLEAGSNFFLRVFYDEDMNPMPDGRVWIDITWIPEDSEESAAGKSLVKSRVTVYWTGEFESIYTLETATLVQGK